MKVKSVEGLSGGEVLAESILTLEKAVLIPKGTQIKENYIPLIQMLDIDALMIEDPYEELEEPNMLIQPARCKQHIEHVQKLMENHIYHSDRALREFEVIANEIVKDIDEMPKDVVFDIRERTSNLYEHTVMVTLLSVAVAKKLRFDHKKRYQIALGCLLHDIGIRYITVKYENRDWSDVDNVEIFEFKKHTILGYSAIEEEDWIPDISRRIILFHHEKLDGSGFPMHQKNREAECRIVQICDTFDCYICGMECQRVSIQSALDTMIKEAGERYDRKIVDKFVSFIARYPVGTIVKMNDGKEGVVISQTPDPEKPVVMLFDEEKSNQKRNLMQEEIFSILQII